MFDIIMLSVAIDILKLATAISHKNFFSSPTFPSPTPTHLLHHYSTILLLPLFYHQFISWDMLRGSPISQTPTSYAVALSRQIISCCCSLLPSFSLWFLTLLTAALSGNGTQLRSGCSCTSSSCF